VNRNIELARHCAYGQILRRTM